MTNTNEKTNINFNNKQAFSYKCPSCGSSLTFNPKSQKLRCDSCKANYTKEELKEKSITYKNKKESEGDYSVKEYSCPSCGAHIITDENTSAEFCAYCSNPVVFEGRLSGDAKPNLIIPFKLTKKDAQEKLFNSLSKYGYIPSSFFKQANLEKITGIYYPFWECDANTTCSLSAQCTKSSTWICGNTQYTKTDYYNVFRSGNIRFDDISITALKSSDKELVESILPYQIQEHQPFDMSFLTGFYAKQKDLEFEDVRSQIDAKINDYSTILMSNTINGYSSIQVNSNSVVVDNIHNDYTLLPVWILSYKCNNKIYTFAVNGSTGKIFGELPFSKTKMNLTFAGIATGLFTVLAILGGLLL